MSYRQIFDEAIGDAPPARVDLDRLIRRERRAAVVRPVLAAAVAVTVVTVGIVTAVGVSRDNQAIPPVDGTVGGFPEYQQGHRMVEVATADIVDGEITITFTLRHPDITVFTRCDFAEGDDPVELTGSLELNSAARSIGYDGAQICGPPGRPLGPVHYGADTEGLTPGERVTASLVLRHARHPDSNRRVEMPTAGTFGLAIAEPVAFEGHALPPRPDRLVRLTDWDLSPEVLLSGDPADPNRPASATFHWNGPDLPPCDPTGDTDFPEVGTDFHLLLQANTPGRLRVSLNGRDLVEETWWDYHAHTTGATIAFRSWSGACLEISRGDLVTVTVEPAHLTGDWVVIVYRNR
jgi:hypothetical protein